MHERMHAVIAGERGQAEIGNDEPLGCERLVFILRGGGCLGDHDVDAGHQRADRLLDRESGGDVRIERPLDAHLAFPDERAAPRGQALDIVPVQRALEIIAEHGIEQVAVADAVDFDVDA
jgi:hypothetical protein